METLDQSVAPGVSWLFVVLFFGPLLVAVAIVTAFTTRRFRPMAKVLTVFWSFATLLAGFFLLMGYAFNSSTLHPLVAIPVWLTVGEAIIWLPLLLRERFAE